MTDSDNKRVPSFVVIGQPNEGKTTVLSTLTENDKAEIGPIPGTTQRCVPYSYKVDDEEILVFYDTPGFQRPAKMLEWLEDHDSEMENFAPLFLKEFDRTGDFQAECEILKPMVKGAAVLYIADASRPVREADRQGFEILRKCGNPRIGVINSKDRAKAYYVDWQKFMRKDFNHCREFDGHRASFRDRRELLEAVGAVVPEWNRQMKEVLLLLDKDWDGRMRKIADIIISLLTSAMTARETATVKNDVGRAKTKAKNRLEDKIRELERKGRRSIIEIFKHTEDHWKPSELEEVDLFSEETWNLFGLSREQLILGGLVTGAASGLAIDALLGGGSLGLAAVIGGILLAGTAYFGADSAVDIKIPLLLRPIFGAHKLGGRKAEAKMKSVSNLPWVLIGRSLSYAEHASQWAHGKRKSADSLATAEIKASNWEPVERDTVSKLIGYICSDKPDQVKLRKSKKDVRDLLVKKLRGATL